MKSGFENARSRVIVEDLVDVIREHRVELSQIDGAIGDGDHGINMAKGFSMAAERIGPSASFTGALKVVGDVLMTEIGGAMGPLYGGFFRGMAKAGAGKDVIDAPVFAAMLDEASAAIQRMGEAKVGDKTLVDTLDPAVKAFHSAVSAGASFAGALSEMSVAAEKGRNSTISLVAKVGRSARLGERSRGALDAGAASCCLILQSMARSITALLS
ncbi:MAG TPA: dihydroxyacetone kinase subunit DhaL [Spirochaetia bacterium]|nr:dihydroxyacetone kinase subunit DhaL [Spirochaetia bacterium]